MLYHGTGVKITTWWEPTEKTQREEISRHLEQLLEEKELRARTLIKYLIPDKGEKQKASLPHERYLKAYFIEFLKAKHHDNIKLSAVKNGQECHPHSWHVDKLLAKPEWRSKQNLKEMKKKVLLAVKELEFLYPCGK